MMWGFFSSQTHRYSVNVCDENNEYGEIWLNKKQQKTEAVTAGLIGYKWQKNSVQGERNITFTRGSSMSLDLNPTEHLWNLLWKSLHKGGNGFVSHTSMKPVQPILSEHSTYYWIPRTSYLHLWKYSITLVYVTSGFSRDKHYNSSMPQ